MEAPQALAELTAISSQIDVAAIFDAEGTVYAATGTDENGVLAIVGAASELLRAAAEVRTGIDPETLSQVEVATRDGSVFVVRDGTRRIVATTGPEPTVGLVFYDLKSCLRSLDEEGANGAA